MPSTFTSSLRLTLPATGENAGTWGNLVNTGITTLIDTSIAGTASITVAGTDYTLTNNNGTTDEARAMVINATGTPGAARNVICPAASKMYVFRNNTTGGFAMTLKTSGGSGIAVPAGQSRLLYCDGTNVVEAVNAFSSLTLGTALGAVSGGTGLTSSGANGNVLTSNGTTWTSAALPAGGLTYIFTTTAVTATDKQGVLTSTAGGSFTVTLPATPATGAQVVVADAGASWGTNNLTVGRNGSTIGGLAQDLVCDITGVSVQFVYDGTTWEVYAQIGGNGGNAATQPGNNAFTGANTFYNATGQTFGTATSTQDGIILAGRAGGSSSFRATLQPTTLTASRTLTLPDATSTVAVLGLAQTFTATQTFSGSSSVLGMVLNDAAEVATISATAATGTINYDITTQSVLYYTTNASANFTVNLRASSGTTLNTALATGQSVTVVFLVTNGGTAYYNNVVQVDGTTSGVTTRWQGGTAPTAGNASSVDIYSYTVVKTAASTYSVFASQTRFA
jgi:hypothetical protein